MRSKTNLSTDLSIKLIFKLAKSISETVVRYMGLRLIMR